MLFKGYHDILAKKLTKLEALHNLFEENNIKIDLTEGNSAFIESVIFLDIDSVKKLIESNGKSSKK